MRHQFDHVVPTVIHHPEEKMTALGRWTHRVVQDPKKYATWAIVIAVSVLVAGCRLELDDGRGLTRRARFGPSSTRRRRRRTSSRSPRTIRNLRLRRGPFFRPPTCISRTRTKDLPNNRDVALPTFAKAIKLYDQVARERPKDSFQARAAALGQARSLEARNELSAAIEQYELVVKNWPGTAGGRAGQRTGRGASKSQ